MNQKGLVPILFIIILVIVGLVVVYLLQNKSSTSTQNSMPNSGNPYQDLKAGLRKAFEK